LVGDIIEFGFGITIEIYIKTSTFKHIFILELIY